MSLQSLQHFIDGKFIVSKSHFTLTSKLDNSIQYEVPACEVLTAVTCIQSAQKAFHTSNLSSVFQRLSIFEKFFGFLESSKNEISMELAKFQGSPTQEVYDFDVHSGLQQFRTAISEMKQFAKVNLNSLEIEKFEIENIAEVSPLNLKNPQEIFQRGFKPQATGLVVILVPSIFSFKCACERLAPALLAGNSVILKLSMKNPLVGIWFAKAAEASGLEPGFLNVLYGESSSIGSVLISHPSVRAVSFAGALKNAEQILKVASTQFKKLQLSTTTKNIAAVLSDANIENAVDQIFRGAVFHSAQSPYSIHRIFVVEAIAEEFIAQMKEKIENFRPNLMSKESDFVHASYNNLVSSDEFETLRTTALEAHAKLLYPNFKFPEGCLAPTFTLDMTNCSTLQQDDLKAPLIVVSTVKYQHEIQKYANVGYYGSKAFLFGSNEKCEKVMHQLHACEIVYNSWKVDSEPLVSSRQSFFGNPDFKVFGSFFSDLKKVEAGLPS